MWEAFFEAVFGTLTREQKVFLMRSAWYGIISFHMVWVCGWVLEPPFAKAGDLKDATRELSLITTQLKQDRADRLDQAIQSVRGLQCRTAIDSPARKNYTDRLNELYSKYVELTGREPHVPSCDQT